MTLCQNRESSLKFTRIPLFIKAYSYFFKSKWGFSFNLVRDQANGPHIKSSTFSYSFNLETSKHDSRSSFIATSDRNVSWRSNQRSFIVLFHCKDSYRELYPHTYKSNTSWLFVTLFHDHVILLLQKLCVHLYKNKNKNPKKPKKKKGIQSSSNTWLFNWVSLSHLISFLFCINLLHMQPQIKVCCIYKIIAGMLAFKSHWY